MKLFHIENGKNILNFDSSFSKYFKLLKTEEPTNIGFIQIDSNGIVGYHHAPVSQLFIVVNGEGWITGEDKKRITVKTGDGVFWEKGEGHESGSKIGMTVLVIQSIKLPFPSTSES